MTTSDEMVKFAVEATYAAISEESRAALKARVLDALGCALGAIDGEPIRRIRGFVEEFAGSGLCTLIGGGRAAPDRAALYNGALVRYLDFNDSYLAPGETCHPSDNLGAILAAAEYAGRSGRDFLTALAVAYQVQCRLSDCAPVRARGFDHVTHLAYSIAAGASRALGLSADQAANAIGMCGTAFNALRVTRTGALSNWKGLAAPNAAAVSLQVTLLARAAITGPRAVFEGNKGFVESIAGPFRIDWPREDLERVSATILKEYNAEIHSQSTIEATLDLQRQAGFQAADVESVEVETFDVAYNIIGGGEEGEKVTVRTKEEADHSLPYLVAVALLDGTVGPDEYRPERIRQSDVQDLLRRVTIRASADLSRHFPGRVPCGVTIRLRNGRVVAMAKLDYAGFTTRPMRWEQVVAKFERLGAEFDAALLRDIVDAVGRLDQIEVKDLTSLLGKVEVVAATATPAKAVHLASFAR